MMMRGGGSNNRTYSPLKLDIYRRGRHIVSIYKPHRTFAIYKSFSSFLFRCFILYSTFGESSVFIKSLSVWKTSSSKLIVPRKKEFSVIKIRTNY